MHATIYPLHVLPMPWYTVGLDYLIHLPMSDCFANMLVVVDHLTRMAHFLPYIESKTTKQIASLFLDAVYIFVTSRVLQKYIA
jgi:hypothetical protein